jgi:dTDP-4-amino-4,6-dideoxygalactose transaminase
MAEKPTYIGIEDVVSQWLFSCGYRPAQQNKDQLMAMLTNAIDQIVHTAKHELHQYYHTYYTPLPEKEWPATEK